MDYICQITLLTCRGLTHVWKMCVRKKCDGIIRLLPSVCLLTYKAEMVTPPSSFVLYFSHLLSSVLQFYNPILYHASNLCPLYLYKDILKSCMAILGTEVPKDSSGTHMHDVIKATLWHRVLGALALPA